MPNKDLLLIDREEKDSDLNPVSVRTKQKYMEVFEDYAHGYMTLKEVAEKHGYADLSSVSRIVKWASRELNKGDKDTWFAISVQRLTRELKELHEELKDTADRALRLKVRGEIRKTAQMLAKMQGLMTMYDQNRDTTVNVVFGDFKRAPAQEKPKIVNGEASNGE